MTNFACLFLDHQGQLSEDSKIGDEDHCWRCGERVVLCCQASDNTATGWAIRWIPRRHVRAGEEDERLTT